MKPGFWCGIVNPLNIGVVTSPAIARKAWELPSAKGAEEYMMDNWLAGGNSNESSS